MSYKNTSILYICIIFGLVGYVLPWITTQTAPLTLGAYDLAEWTSLHPSQPHTMPVLVVPLLLRIHLVIITLIIALSAHTDKLRMLAIVAIIPLALGQLPPLEFLTIATDNINYQQQFILATISLIVGLALTIVKPTQFIPQINILLIGIGVISAGVGLQQAQILYTMSLQESSFGAGIIVLCLAYLVIATIHLQHLNIKLPINSKQQPSENKTR
jgi:hypothetical protein